MKKLLSLLAIASASAIGQQPDVGTVDVQFQKISTGGQLKGCSLTYSSLVNDTVYRAGEKTFLSGNISIQQLGSKSLSLTGKLGTKPLAKLDSSSWEAPSYFFFSSGTGSTAGSAKMIDSDVKGFRLLLADATAPGIKELVGNLAGGKFTVGFNRKTGGMDVLSAIDASISLTTDPSGRAKQTVNHQTMTAFSECLTQLMGNVSRELSTP